MINNDKNALIKSMNNLIKHITSSKQSQQQIFQSLELKDFQKIINNLADHIRELRLTSALLIGLLLHDSEGVQKQFCSTMNIHFSNDSEIIFNNNFDKLITLFPSKITQIIKLMKTHGKSRTSISNRPCPLIWFINPEKQNLSIQYLSKQQIQDLIKIQQSNLNPEDLCFDPLYCIFGICMVSSIQSTLKQKSTQNTQLSDSRDLTSKINQRTVPQNPQPQISYTQQIKDYSTLKRQFPIQGIHGHNQVPSLVNGPPYKIQRHITESFQHEKPQLTQRKISLTDNKKKKKEQPNVVRFVYENNYGNMIRSCDISKNKKEQPVPANIHYSGHYPKMMDQVSYSTPIRTSYGHNQQINRSHNLVAPSMKVKNIAINGRLGWQTAKNHSNTVAYGNQIVY